MSRPLTRRAVFLCLGFSLLFSCASAPRTNETHGSDASSSVNASDNSDEETKTALPSAGRRRGARYFSGIDENILADVENGSPASLRRAAAALRKSELEYAENEKTLLAVAAAIMKIAWPQEKADWDVPKLAAETPYTGAINSAREGIYDTSTGNADFLSIVLPSLAVITGTDAGTFFPSARAALKNALSLRPESVLASYLLGTLYAKTKAYADALPHLLNAHKSAPECFEAGFSYADCLRLAGRTQEANEKARTLLEKYPANPALLKLAAETSFELGNLSRAEEYISRLLQQDPSDLQGILFRARVLVAKNDYIHAASLLDVYARQDSASKDYLLLRAQIQYDWSKNTAAALATIENALKTYPGDKDAMLFAARLAGETGSPVLGKSASEYAGAVLEKDPGNENALQFALDGFIRSRNWEKAYALSSDAVKKQTVSNAAVFSHIKICLALRKYDEAWNLISPLYREHASDEDVVQNYIAVLAETGRTTQALNLINRLLDSSSTRMKSFLYYRRSLLQDSENAALADLRASLIANPRNSDALFRLYEIYNKKNDYRKAQYYLKQVIALNPNDSRMRTLNDRLESLIK
ncbi:MAG: tetratricopeptide repeat protein [Treponema sp.]